MPEWYFPLNNGGEEQGLNDPGVESFKEADSLAREATQNVLDNPADPNLPREIEFELINLPCHVFPGIENFRGIMKACKETMGRLAPDGKVEKAFFDQAFEILSPEVDKIPTLRIRDKNTTGLEGSDDERAKPFCRLLRIQGVSSPQGVGGGTYGIGQRAPFSCSALRTVLYYTRRQSDRSQAFCAKSILCTFDDPDESTQIRQSKGWWCEVSQEKPDRWTAVRDEEKINPFFRREESGTDLYITGFSLYRNDWEKVIRHALLSNFFIAIHLKELVCRIMDGSGGETVFDHSTLENELIRAAEEERSSGMESTEGGVGAAYAYWRAYRSPVNGEPFKKEIPGIGEVKLFVHHDIQDSNLPNSWCYMRKPHMVVGFRTARVVGNFAGVLVCDNDLGNSYLAGLEGKEHREWKTSNMRNPTQDERKQAEKIEKEIKDFVRESLKSLRADYGVAVLDPSQVGNYLPDDEPEYGPGVHPGIGATVASGSPGSGGVVRTDPIITQTQRVRKKKDLEKPKINIPKQGGEKDKDDKSEMLPPGKGGGPGVGSDQKEKRLPKSGNEGAGNVKFIRPEDVSFRSFNNGSEIQIVLTSSKDVAGCLHLVAQGEGKFSEEVKIQEAYDLSANTPVEVQGPNLKGISLKSGVPSSFRVKIEMGRACLRVGKGK